MPRDFTRQIRVFRTSVQKSYLYCYIYGMCVYVCVYFVKWIQIGYYTNYASMSDNVIAFGLRINVYRVAGARFALERCPLHVQLNPDYLVPDIFAVLRL